MRKARLTLKGSKCALFRHKVEYLGHIVSRDGVQPTDSKIEAIRHWAEPSNLTDVRAFLGITSYYRTYIGNYSEIAEPLTRLTKKDTPFVWGEPQRNAFNTLRKALCTKPILAYPKRGGRFWLDTDASNYAIGAVLSQEQDGELRVIAYASKTLGPTQRYYCATKKELLAVVYFTRHFRHYLMGDVFNIRTDHASLQWLMSFRQTDNMQQRWLQCMQNYTFDLHHRDGKKHLNADSMSRMVRQQHHCGREECVDCNHAFRQGAAKKSKPVRNPPSDPDEDDWSGAEDLEWPKVDFVGCQFVPRTKEQLASDRRRLGLGEDGSSGGGSDQTSTSKGRGYRSTIYHARRSSRLASKADADPNWREKDDSRRQRPTRRAAAKRALARIKRWAGSDSEDESDTKQNSFQSLKGRQRRLRSRRAPVGDRFTLRGRPANKPSRPSRSSPNLDDGPDRLPTTSDSGVDTMDPESGEEGGRSLVKEQETPDHRWPEGESTEGSLPDGWWLQGLKVEDWERKQNEDVILVRLKGLLEKYVGDPPPPKLLSSEDKELRQYCRHWGDYVLKKGVVRRRFFPYVHSDEEKEQVLVPMQMRQELFMRIHGADAGHLGYARVHKLMEDRFWWVGMSTDLLEWLGACHSCQTNRVGPGKAKYPLIKEINSFPMERVAMDVMGPWDPPTARGNRFVIVLQDYYSKWVEVWAAPDHTAETVSWLLASQFLGRFGSPHRFHSDQGREFESKLMAEVCKLWEITKTRTTPYAPWSDGMVERANRTIQQMLATCYQENLSDWDLYVWAVAQRYNSTVHASTHCTPFRLFLSRGEEARLPVDLVYGTPLDTHSTEYLCPQGHIQKCRAIMQKLNEFAREKLRQTALTQVTQHDRAGLRIRTYVPGQFVYQYYGPWASKKMKGPWRGPWEVVESFPNKMVIVRALPGGKEKELKLHASSLKPVKTTKEGYLLDSGNRRVFRLPSPRYLKEHNEKYNLTNDGQLMDQRPSPWPGDPPVPLVPYDISDDEGDDHL